MRVMLTAHLRQFALWPCSISAALVCLAIVFPAAAAGDDTRTGEQIYRQMCASCHGASGEGTDENHPDPLAGDKSVAQLADVIAETMPEDDPGTCTGEDAKLVAAYIYDAFYSPTAQARNKPPRIELSRLTVRQYQNAVADLIGSFSQPGKWGDERGLHGEYYDSRRTRREKRMIERIDATVDFDYEAASPDPETIGTDEFSASWEGAILAPDTGDYEFILETKNGARLWINDRVRPLVDAWVKSGDQSVYRESIRLLGGRAYPLKLEFFKYKEPTASITLKWKPPHQAEEVVPQRCLSPLDFPETLVVGAPFPPDDRSIGYERGTSVSKEWDQATTLAAIEVTGKVVAKLRDLAGVGDSSSNRSERLREFCGRFAERAFRRPLSPDEKQFFIDRQFEQAADPETAVKRVVLLVLKSPRFLYREAGLGKFDDYDVAAWLSFGLWDSIPDAELLKAAVDGQLRTREQIAGQAERMVADLRTRSKVREFLHQWLTIDRFHEISKDAKLFPEFNEAIVSDLRTSLDLFLDDVVWGEASDFRQLLLADYVYLNGRLAKFYGADLPPDAPFQRVTLEPEQRAGILTHPYLMAGFAYYATSSPIHRGVFLARSVLGRFLKPPPEAVTPLAPDLHPSLTTRERVSLQTSPAMCNTCHAMINPLGFSLEHFDAVGRYRSEERDRPVDAVGLYQTRDGASATFAGARELGTFLSGAEETHDSFVEQLFSYIVKQPIRAFGPNRLTDLRQSFAGNNFSVRRLLVEMITASAVGARESAERNHSIALQE